MMKCLYVRWLGSMRRLSGHVRGPQPGPPAPVAGTSGGPEAAEGRDPPDHSPEVYDWGAIGPSPVVLEHGLHSIGFEGNKIMKFNLKLWYDEDMYVGVKKNENASEMDVIRFILGASTMGDHIYEVPAVVDWVKGNTG